MKGFWKHFSLGCLLLFSIVSQANDDEVIDAQWKTYQVFFNFQGLDLLYTCDGLERKIRKLLILIGARGDARVESLCRDINNIRDRNVRSIQRGQKLRLAFALPVPADLEDESRDIFKARWSEVKLVGNLRKYLDANDCEMIQQFNRQVMPFLIIKGWDKPLNCAQNRNQYRVIDQYRTLRVKLQILQSMEEADSEKVF